MKSTKLVARVRRYFDNFDEGAVALTNSARVLSWPGWRARTHAHTHTHTYTQVFDPVCRSHVPIPNPVLCFFDFVKKEGAGKNI